MRCNFGLFWSVYGYIFITKRLQTPKINLAHAEGSMEMNKQHTIGLISNLAESGTFWPFLATFGIEIITRWYNMFFKYSIWLKIIYASIICWCTNHATMIIQHSYIVETQKLRFLLNSPSKNFNFYKFHSGFA